MATLCAIINHKRAPIGSQQLRLAKAVEQLYYILLFTGASSYKARPETWRSWLGMGLDVSTKAPPPGTADLDRITMTVRSNGKSPELYGSSPNKPVVEKLHRLLADIDALRGSMTGTDKTAKEIALLDDAKVARQLVNPLRDCLKQNGLRQDEIESYMLMVRRGLLALTHDEVTSIQLSLR